MARAERPAVFLDRDGTIVRDTGYIDDPDDIELLPGAAEALRAMRSAGLALVVVSNQSGMARGLMTEEQAALVNARFIEELSRLEVHLDGVYYCPHGPDDGCACRKPLPGLLLEAARDLDLSLDRSYMVGDRQSDVEAGRAAGCRALLLHGKHDWPGLVSTITSGRV